MLLTSMPGEWDYMFLVAIYNFGFSFIASIIIILIIGLIKKGAKTTNQYFVLWLKIFAIIFTSILAIAFIILFAI